MLFADSGALAGFICFGLLPALVVLGWVLNQRAKERKAEAQRPLQQRYGQPPHPSLTHKVVAGIRAYLIAGIVKAMFGGHRHHGHQHDKHGG